MKSLLTVIFIFSFTLINAQFDDRFYYPQKEWQTIADSIKYKVFNFKVDKGVKLNGILLTPDSTPKGYFLFLHGAGGNVSKYLEMTQPLVNRGYSVFMIDFRGYGKSDGKPTHLNIEHDVLIVFDKLSQLPNFEGKKLLVYGASMGTQAAAILARERAQQIELLIIDGGLSSFTDIAVDSAPEEQKEVISKYLISPYSLKEIIKNTSGLKKWIIHSKEDSGVPYKHALVNYENASEPKFMWTYEGEHLEAITKQSDKFFEKLDLILKE